MRVLITGAEGFIGSHLVDKLVENKKIKKVIVIDHLLDGTLINLKKSLSNRKFKLVNSSWQKSCNSRFVRFR